MIMQQPYVYKTILVQLILQILSCRVNFDHVIRTLVRKCAMCITQSSIQFISPNGFVDRHSSLIYAYTGNHIRQIIKLCDMHMSKSENDFNVIIKRRNYYYLADLFININVTTIWKDVFFFLQLAI